jgi:hypothetical protein
MIPQESVITATKSVLISTESALVFQESVKILQESVLFSKGIIYHLTAACSYLSRMGFRRTGVSSFPEFVCSCLGVIGHFTQESDLISKKSVFVSQEVVIITKESGFYLK